MWSDNKLHMYNTHVFLTNAQIRQNEEKGIRKKSAASLDRHQSTVPLTPPTSDCSNAVHLLGAWRGFPTEGNRMKDSMNDSIKPGDGKIR